MSDNQKQFRLPDGAAPHYHDGEPVGNEPFAPSDAERQMLGDLLVPVHSESESESESAEAEAEDDSESEDSPDGTADEQGADEFVDHNATDVADAIAAGDADGHLADVREAEAAGSDRVTVHEALDERADETGEDAGESGE